MDEEGTYVFQKQKPTKNLLEVMAGTCSSEQLKPSVPMGQVEKTVTIVIHQGSNSMGLHRYLSSLQLEEQQPQNPHMCYGKMYFFELSYFISIITFKFSSLCLCSTIFFISMLTLYRLGISHSCLLHPESCLIHRQWTCPLQRLPRTYSVSRESLLNQCYYGP